LAESPISRYKKGNTFMNRKLAEVYAFDIQAGDMVKDAEGRIYTAASNAELDQWGEYNVLSDTGYYYAYGKDDAVTISYIETDEYQYA